MDFPNSKGSYNELQVAKEVGMPYENASGFSEETLAYLDTLNPEERQQAIEEINAPLTGEEVSEALKQDADYVPEEADYLKFVAFNKTRETSIIDGIGAGAEAVLSDLSRAVGAVADHPLKALSQAPASLIEAFAQGTRNLYGMVAQSSDPNSILFGFKNAIAGDGSPEGYQQFLEARKFNKHSAALASGEETIIMDKNVIDKDITLAMSYIADPTLFVPFGTAASAGMRAVGMGEKLTMLAARTQSLKASVIGGGLKWGVGAPIEAVGAVTRGTIDKAIAVGGNVLETATGMSTKELQATARMSAVGTTTASVLGGHIPVASTLSNVYLGAGAAAGIGEAAGAVGEQIMKQGFKRGYNSFAREALEQTPNLSAHAKGLLKVLDTLDPMMSYGYGMAEGVAQGAVVGGGLGYLSGGAEGMGQGIGAGGVLGGAGALAGRAYADATGGTMAARSEVRGGFVIENMKADKHPNLPAVEAVLLRGTLAGDRAGALQVIGALDRINPDMRLIAENASSYETILKAKGVNADGHKVDPVTGKVLIDSNGKPIQFEAPLRGFYGGEGFTMMTEKDGDGKQQVTVVINTDAKFKSTNTLHHEIFHAVFKTTVMEKMFRDNFSEAILGKFDANGIKVKPAEIDPKEFKAFATRELRNTVDVETGKKLSELPEKLNARLALLDTHLAEYQKAGSTSRMNPESAKALDYLVEEFGAHYATQFMKGKPVDYLFYGAEYTGMRGVMDRLHNGFLDFWQKNVTKQNPTFGDFTGDKTFDKSFGPNDGKRTLAQRSSAIDYMVQDLLRSVAGKRKGSTNSFDVRTLSPEARTAFLGSSGMDGFKHYFDKDGKRRNLTEDQVKAERIQVGKAVHDSLSKLDPKEVAGLKDVEGSFVANSTVGTKFSDTMLNHLVNEGHITPLLAERIKNIQEITSGNGSNVISYLYKGDSMETEVGPNSKRVYGADVPITSRNTIVVGYDIKVKKDGTMSLVMKGLDKNLIDARGNEQWAKPEVRDLWQGDRNEFDKSFFEYLSNASKASTDPTRQESSLLPSLARGDGFGAERRNIMHQFLGMAKRKGEKYFNTPIAEIPRGNTSTVFNQRIDFMSPVKSDLPIRYDFNLDNAHSDLSRNYKVSDMEHEATPQGDVFTHASKYKIVANKEGAANLYDADGKMLGAFKDKDLAGKAMEKAYAAERVETEKRIERVIADQQKQQQTFKVWDDETIAEARRIGDIFETDAGKAFHAGTELIRQTREEFYSDNFIKLRQADPEVALQAVEQVMARVNKIEQLKTQLEDAFYATKEPNAVKKNIKRQELMNISAHLQRYNDIRLAYSRATRNGQRNGQAILDYINTHRRTSTGYDNMAKVFFGDQYDAQFQTGKPVTTVATHGTNSNELLTSKEFDINKLGSRHMNPNDRVGVFLSGETKTSFGYADPKEGEFGYRQVRAAVKFNNPLVLDYGFQCFDGAKYDRIFKQARAGGHDGIVIKNVYDGGSADTVFIVMANKVKENTAIIDTHIGMDRVTRKSEQIGSVSADSDQGSVRYPIQESVPRGKGVRVGSDLGLSWKVGDELTAKEKESLKIVRETLPMLHPELWEDLKKSGFVIKNFDAREITGEVLVLNPDPMIVGNVKQGKDAIVQDALGGSLFPAGQDARAGNELWANAQGTAKLYNRYLSEIYARKLEALNETARKEKWSVEKLQAEADNIRTHIILTKGSDQKVLSNPTAFKGSTTLLKRFVKEGIVSDKTIKERFQLMSERREAVKVQDDGSHLDAKGNRITERVHAETTDFKDIMELPLSEFLAEVNRRAAISFETRGDLIKDTLKSLSEAIDIKKPKSLAKMRAMFDDPNFNLKKNSNLGDAFALRFGEPYTDGLKPSDAHTSISYKGKTKVVKGSHPDYPYSIVSEGAGKPTIHMFSDAIPIEQLVDKTIDANPERVNKKTGVVTPANELYFKDVKELGPAGANKLGTNVTGVSKARMKALKDIPAKPEGEGRIGMNYKVDDWKSEQAIKARKDQPMKLWEYPSASNFIKWATGLPLIKSLSSQLDSNSLSKGFVTTVYKGVRGRNFDSFKDRNMYDGTPRDSYGRDVSNRKDPNYFVADFKSAKDYAEARVSMSDEVKKTLKENKAYSFGSPDMYYIRSENPAILTDLINLAKTDSKVISDVREFWEKYIKDEFFDDPVGETDDTPRSQLPKYKKLVEYNFDAFLKMVKEGRFLGSDMDKKDMYFAIDKKYAEAEQLGHWNDYWLEFSKFLLEKGYDSVVVNDNSVSKNAPTIVIDQSTTNVKGSSNYGDFSSTDTRYNFKVSDSEPKTDLKSFEGNFKVSDSVKSGVRTLGKFVDDNADTANLSPDIKDAMKALREAVRRQDATDEVLVPEVREAYDKIVAAVDRGIDTPALTPVAVLKELKKTLKPLNKEISQNSKDTAKRIADKDMAEGADLESDAIAEGKATVRRDMEEGADMESDQVTSEIDRKRGDARLDVEEGASFDADEATGRIAETIQDLNDGADIEASEPRNQNLPRQFPNPAPPVPAGLPSYKASSKPAFPRPPATPLLPQVKPSGTPAFPRPPATPALPRGSIAPPPPQGTPAPALPPSKPMGKLEGWRGWTLEKGLNGGFWKNAVGWMIVVQADKFKVYNPQKAMQGIYEDLEAAKRRVQRAEPKQ